MLINKSAAAKRLLGAHSLTILAVGASWSMLFQPVLFKSGVWRSSSYQIAAAV
jgi:hypothetical protein